MTLFLFACLLYFDGTALPGWAWVWAIFVATLEVLMSDMARAFWRGLTGQ